MVYTLGGELRVIKLLFFNSRDLPFFGALQKRVS